jgi:NADH:ubiquinone oxidoreductase subunit 6 (subunit J)
MPDLPGWFPIPLYVAGAVGLVTVAVMMGVVRKRPHLTWDQQRIPFWITFVAASVVVVGMIVMIGWPALQAASRGNAAALPVTIIVGAALIAGFSWLTLRGMVRTLRKARGAPPPDASGT